MKNLAEFEFSASPVNQGLVSELHEGGFLATQRSAVLIDETGTKMTTALRDRLTHRCDRRLGALSA
jgi:hypothetical protein